MRVLLTRHKQGGYCPDRAKEDVRILTDKLLSLTLRDGKFRQHP